MKELTTLALVIGVYVLLDVAYLIKGSGQPLFSWARFAHSLLVVAALCLFRWATTR